MGDLDATIRDLLWSVWTELGVPGTFRHHRRVALDPEPIVAHTPFLCNDHRLLGLAFDWCVAHANRLSTSRLARIAEHAPGPVTEAFARFNAALEQEAVRWSPRDGAALPLERQREVVALPMDRPALVQLRLRALAGVSIRAEVLAGLLAADRAWSTAVTLEVAGVSRRSVERVLAGLAEADLVAVDQSRAARSYRLREGEALAQVVQSDGLAWPDWTRVLSVASELRTLGQDPAASADLRNVEAIRCRRRIEELAGPRHVPGLPRLTGREDAFELLVDWGVGWLAPTGGTTDDSAPPA